MGKLRILSLPLLQKTAIATYIGHRAKHSPFLIHKTAVSFAVCCEKTPSCIRRSVVSVGSQKSRLFCVFSDDSENVCRSSHRKACSCTLHSKADCIHECRSLNYDSCRYVSPQKFWGTAAHLALSKCSKAHLTYSSVHTHDTASVRHIHSFSRSRTMRVDRMCYLRFFDERFKSSQHTQIAALGNSDSRSGLFSLKQHLNTLCTSMLQPERNKPIRISARRWLHSAEQFSLENAGYNDYLESLVSEHSVLLEALLKGESSDDHAHFKHLETVATTKKELDEAYAELADLRTMLTGETDKELQAMAQTDVDRTLQHIQHLEEQLMDVLVGPEPGDKNDIMLEVSAGVGGQEAMLFTAEMFDMYSRYADFKGWTFDPVDNRNSELGGCHRASALIRGLNVYKHLKFEAGVHRVQRIPKTEKAGRIHTSTMTVAVLPQPSEVDITVNQKDLQIDRFRASGAGGQHVNTTESAVRVTHKPTGVVVECQKERSQIHNLKTAMDILRSRLYQKQVEEQENALRRKRKLQVGSAGRSEKIRTYNYGQDRVTDHRGPITFYNISQFMSGEDAMEDLLQNLMKQSQLEALQAMVDHFLESRQQKKQK